MKFSMDGEDLLVLAKFISDLESCLANHNMVIGCNSDGLLIPRFAEDDEYSKVYYYPERDTIEFCVEKAEEEDKEDEND